MTRGNLKIALSLGQFDFEQNGHSFNTARSSHTDASLGLGVEDWGHIWLEKPTIF